MTFLDESLSDLVKDPLADEFDLTQPVPSYKTKLPEKNVGRLATQDIDDFLKSESLDFDRPVRGVEKRSEPKTAGGGLEEFLKSDNFLNAEWNGAGLNRLMTQRQQEPTSIVRLSSTLEGLDLSSLDDSLIPGGGGIGRPSFYFAKASPQKDVRPSFYGVRPPAQTEKENSAQTSNAQPTNRKLNGTMKTAAPAPKAVVAPAPQPKTPAAADVGTPSKVVSRLTAPSPAHNSPRHSMPSYNNTPNGKSPAGKPSPRNTSVSLGKNVPLSKKATPGTNTLKAPTNSNLTGTLTGTLTSTVKKPTTATIAKPSILKKTSVGSSSIAAPTKNTTTTPTARPQTKLTDTNKDDIIRNLMERQDALEDMVRQLQGRVLELENRG
ncbi:hypothetical protein PROFUN_15320 [Planoprotostelium fungivorum]|uniref:Uncharacterized protein n=1 Tax=Planoprotostelium fungivorum TaxID=1890364 RepID=A0A2P6MX05_9EUKA|nr:hypothetical protein PROFUN_15320 [Planoprotostelium fungivorum]